MSQQLLTKRAIDPPVLPKPKQQQNNNKNESNNNNDSSQCNVRYLVILLFVLLGVFHLGRWTCMVQHQEDIFEGGVITKKISSSTATISTATTEYALTFDKLQNIRRQAKQLISELDEYYSQHNGGAKNILMGPGGWANGWEFGGNAAAATTTTTSISSNNETDDGVTREEKLIETMARALLDPQQGVFRIGVIGSSVAAGHDNCRYDNYQSQLERTWSTVWEAAGMAMEVQNAGQGGSCGDSHKNQVWCIEQNVSPNVDIVHYSWSYFEVGDKPRFGANERESLVRWTQLLPSSPPVHVINVEQKDDCFDNKYKQWEPKLFEAYKEYGYNAFCMRYALKNSHVRDDVDGLFEGQHVGDGFHNTTRYGLNETNTERRDSLGVVLRNWHPGPLGFQLIADAVMYTYTLAILAALDRIEAVSSNHATSKKKKDEVLLFPVNTSSPEAAWWEDRPIVLGESMKEPLVCDPHYCKVSQAPKCLNFELPTFGYWGASIAQAQDDLNPFQGQVQAWKHFQQGLEEKNLWRMVNRLETALYKENPEMCIFPDHCAGIESNSQEDGLVVFKLPKIEVGMISLCFCCGKEVARTQLLENQYVEVTFNGRVLSNSTWDLFPEKKCVRVVKDHGTEVGSLGHSYLSVRLLEGNKETVRISHVITI